MGSGEVRRLASVQQDRPSVAAGQDLVDLEQRRRSLVEKRTQLAVAAHVELEVPRADGLTLSNGRDERVYGCRSA